MKLRGLMIICSVTVGMTGALVENNKEICMDFVQYFIRKTTIYPLSGLPIAWYCENITDTRLPIDMNDVINFYKSLPSVKSESIASKKSPVTEFGIAKLSGEEILPLHLTADIRSHHFNPFNSILPNKLKTVIDRQMRFLGMLPSDEPGQLLPVSMGGSYLLWNIFPISKRNLRQVPDTFTEKPKTDWQSITNWVKSFLLHHYVNGRVQWRIVLHYYNETLISPRNFKTYRPTSFTLQFTAFKDQFNATDVFYRSPEMTFVNSENEFCKYEMNEIDTSLYDVDFRSACLIREPFGLLNTKSRRTNPLNCTLYEVSMGPLKSCDRDTEPYTFAFLFNFTKTYFFAYKIEDTRWFIREILSDGKLGSQSDQGYASRKFHKVFPFSIDNEQYFLDLDDSGKYTITELLPEGKMGRKTDEGDMGCVFNITLPVEFRNKKYLYLQCKQNYFFQELGPGGTLEASKISTGSWQDPYTNALAFNFNDKLYFYFQNDDDMSWNMHEVVGSSLNFDNSRQNGQWDEPFEHIIQHHIDDYNLLLLHSRDTYELAVKHFNLRGYIKLGDIENATTSSIDYLKTYYHILLPYAMDGEHYLFGHEKENYTWIIRQIIVKKIILEDLHD